MDKNIRKHNKKIKVRKAILITLVIVIALSAISAVDASTSRIMKLKDKKHVLAVHISEDKAITIEVVGKTFIMEAQKILEMPIKLYNKTKDIFSGTAK